MQNLGCQSWLKGDLCWDFHYLSRRTRFWHSQTIRQGLTTLPQGLKTHVNNPGPSKNVFSSYYRPLVKSAYQKNIYLFGAPSTAGKPYANIYIASDDIWWYLSF